MKTTFLGGCLESEGSCLFADACSDILFDIQDIFKNDTDFQILFKVTIYMFYTFYKGFVCHLCIIVSPHLYTWTQSCNCRDVCHHKATF